MARTKSTFLDLETIRKICSEYAKGRFSMSELSKKYHITRESLRNIFAKAIIFGYIDTDLALQMKEIAIKNSYNACIRNGVVPNNNLEYYYTYLINASNRRKELSDRINYIRFNLETYDDHFSCDEDYPYSKEDLINELTKCKTEIKTIEKII